MAGTSRVIQYTSFNLIDQSILQTSFKMAPHNSHQEQSETMMTSFRQLDRKFRRSCHHIRMLNRRIQEVQIRYDRAFSTGRRSFRYSHRLKLATYEGMRNMYYEYACRRADELEKMQDALIERGLVSDSNGDSDSESDLAEWSLQPYIPFDDFVIKIFVLLIFTQRLSLWIKFKTQSTFCVSRSLQYSFIVLSGNYPSW